MNGKNMCADIHLYFVFPLIKLACITHTHDILYEFQSGFRSKFSTESCLIHLFDFIRDNTTKGLYTGMVMLDLQKAFETVDHAILCKKTQRNWCSIC